MDNLGTKLVTTNGLIMWSCHIEEQSIPQFRCLFMFIILLTVFCFACANAHDSQGIHNRQSKQMFSL
jgi:hypothetical protein